MHIPPEPMHCVLDLLFSGLIQGALQFGGYPRIDRLHIALQVVLLMLRHDQPREVVEHLRDETATTDPGWKVWD